MMGLEYTWEAQRYAMTGAVYLVNNEPEMGKAIH